MELRKETLKRYNEGYIHPTIEELEYIITLADEHTCKNRSHGRRTEKYKRVCDNIGLDKAGLQKKRVGKSRISYAAWRLLLIQAGLISAYEA